MNILRDFKYNLDDCQDTIYFFEGQFYNGDYPEPENPKFSQLFQQVPEKIVNAGCIVDYLNNAHGCEEEHHLSMMCRAIRNGLPCGWRNHEHVDKFIKAEFYDDSERKIILDFIDMTKKMEGTLLWNANLVIYETLEPSEKLWVESLPRHFHMHLEMDYYSEATREWRNVLQIPFRGGDEDYLGYVVEDEKHTIIDVEHIISKMSPCTHKSHNNIIIMKDDILSIYSFSTAHA